MRALNLSFLLPFGPGILVMISSKTLSTFNPVLAETKQASSQGKPIVSSISFFVPSTFALGKSTLFITGIISKSLSSAKYTFARVCASTP